MNDQSTASRRGPWHPPWQPHAPYPALPAVAARKAEAVSWLMGDAPDAHWTPRQVALVEAVFKLLPSLLDAGPAGSTVHTIYRLKLTPVAGTSAYKVEGCHRMSDDSFMPRRIETRFTGRYDSDTHHLAVVEHKPF